MLAHPLVKTALILICCKSQIIFITGGPELTVWKGQPIPCVNLAIWQVRRDHNPLTRLLTRCRTAPQQRSPVTQTGRKDFLNQSHSSQWVHMPIIL